MAAALKRKDHVVARCNQVALVDAANDATAAADLLTLIYFASIGMGQDRGAAVVRGAMTAHGHLEATRDRIREARDEIHAPNQPAEPYLEGTKP